jgi:glucoamylase
VLGLSACGGGGGSSSGSSGSSAGTISGVAATGKAIADATVTLIDIKGKTATGTTNGNGVFTINTSGLTPPFLLAVKSNAGSTSGMYLYSVSDSASPATIGANTGSQAIRL